MELVVGFLYAEGPETNPARFLEGTRKSRPLPNTGGCAVSKTA